MEENENKPVEEEVIKTEEVSAESATENPSREEILAMSREENKQGDEMKKDIYKTASSYAMRVGILIAIVYSVVNLIVNKNELFFPLYSLVGGMMATDFICIGKKENKKGLFIGGIIEAVCAGVLMVLSILGMCGVIGFY